MKLILNETPKWTKKHMDFFRKYEQSYGISISEALYQEELNNIINGNPSPRCCTSQWCYEIFENDLYLGDIITNEDNEIDILIFDEYAGNSYAYMAIKLFLEEHHTSGLCFEAVVREENKEKERIKNVLNKVGFYNVETSIEGNEIWQFK
ncbi:N-acetyltransferase [Clostridium sp.]|uniref:N-acetyltransferase n=1 Tax=Clostridium sp. TaxID=1506 RepID=UPI003216AD0B